MGRRKHTSGTTVSPILFTIPQVAVTLSLGRTKVYELIKYEGLPTVTFGSAIRVPVASLERWLEQREKGRIA